MDHLLGHGGMGAVVAATHLELHQQVAIKVLLPATAKSEEAITRFLREGRAAARLTSPYAAKVFDNGRLPSGEPYLVMELLSGRDLRTYMASAGRVPLAQAVEWALQAAHALGEAHRLNVIHRDVKPANLFLAETSAGTVVKVVDFGVSKQIDEHASDLTNTATILGTPRYMAPEQMRSARLADERCDVWSLGVVLYELTTGESPFRGDTVTALCFDVMERTPLAPSHHAPELPPGFDACIARCLAKDPDERFPTMEALAQALRPFASPATTLGLAHAAPASRPSVPPPPASRPSMAPPHPAPAVELVTPRVAAPRSGASSTSGARRRGAAMGVALGVGALGTALVGSTLLRDARTVADADPRASAELLARSAPAVPSSTVPSSTVSALEPAPITNAPPPEVSVVPASAEPIVDTADASASAPPRPRAKPPSSPELCDPPRWKDKNGHWVPKPYCL